MESKPYNRMDGIRRKGSTPSVVKPRVISPLSNNQKDLELGLSETTPKRFSADTTVSTRQETRRRKSHHLGFMTLSVLAALIGDFIILNQISGAEIKVTPHREWLTIDSPITAHKNAGEGELEFSMIAVTENVDMELTPDTSEVVRTYAQGELRVFNDYSTAPQRLVPQTRFESVNGLVYLTGSEEILIPGKTDAGPGEIMVKVQAVEPGDVYNIDATDFSIPGFHEQGLDEKYAHIYALSLEPFTGGSEETVPGISTERKETSLASLKTELTTRLQDLLVAEKTPEMFLIQKTPVIQYQEPKYSVSENGIGVLSLSGTIYALLLDQDELGHYLADTFLPLDKGLTANLAPGTSLTPTLTEANSSFNFREVSLVSFTINEPILFEWELEDEMILDTFTGLPMIKIPEIVSLNQWIGSIRIKNNPRWRKYLPLQREDISVRILK